MCCYVLVRHAQYLQLNITYNVSLDAMSVIVLL